MVRIRDRKLVLKDGREFLGFGFGADTDALSELVFNTSMVGYQEIISDQSYVEQAVIMTYPLIGNYGMTDDDYESHKTSVSALIVRDYNNSPSNFRYTKTLDEILDEHNIPGISGLDTRMLTRIIRDEGAQTCFITSADTPKEQCLAALNAYKAPNDHVMRITCKRPWHARTSNPLYSVVAVDCGIKSNILRRLNERRINVTVVPANTSAKDIMALRPDGLFLSNGPGDPKDMGNLIDLVRELKGKLPIFGICLGNQIIALSYGADTFHMKFGHRGGNHPVMNKITGLVEITAQNHGYSVDRASLKGTGLQETHVNLLDDTVEGICCPEDMVYSVQYHPESAPGPQDSDSFFDLFKNIIGQNKAQRGKKNA